MPHMVMIRLWRALNITVDKERAYRDSRFSTYNKSVKWDGKVRISYCSTSSRVRVLTWQRIVTGPSISLCDHDDLRQSCLAGGAQVAPINSTILISLSEFVKPRACNFSDDPNNLNSWNNPTGQNHSIERFSNYAIGDLKLMCCEQSNPRCSAR